MRELEMRMRVFRFLKVRLRDTIMPATVGIGLAVGGCAKEGLAAHDGGSGATADGPTYVQIEVFPLYGAPVVGDGPLADSFTPDLSLAPDSNSVGDGPSDLPDGARDTGVAMDQASAIDTGNIETGRDLGIITKYIAPIPDAAVDTRIIGVLYAAIVPADAGADLGGVATRYGAQNPDAS